MTVADDVRKIAAEAREPIRQWLEAAETITAFREVATKKDLNWSALKAVIIASIKDEEDGGERVKKLADKADDALTYADALGNKIKFSEASPPPKPHKSSPVSVSVAAGTVSEAAAPLAAPIPNDDLSIPEFLRRPN